MVSPTAPRLKPRCCRGAGARRNLNPQLLHTMAARRCVSALLGLSLLVMRAGADCPAGPFKLHNFSYDAQAVDKESARPYFIVLCDLSTTVRLDPLVHPDKLECHSHMHSVFGSNRFGPTVSLEDSILEPEELSNTSCHIPADGSMYWAPSMYFHNRTDNKYYLVPVYMKAYYLNRGATEPMALMPVGLRMLV